MPTQDVIIHDNGCAATVPLSHDRGGLSRLFTFWWHCLMGFGALAACARGALRGDDIHTYIPNTHWQRGATRLTGGCAEHQTTLCDTVSLSSFACDFCVHTCWLAGYLYEYLCPWSVEAAHLCVCVDTRGLMLIPPACVLCVAAVVVLAIGSNGHMLPRQL